MSRNTPFIGSNSWIESTFITLGKECILHILSSFFSACKIHTDPCDQHHSKNEEGQPCDKKEHAQLRTLYRRTSSDSNKVRIQFDRKIHCNR